MSEDVEGAIQRTKIAGRRVCSAELQRAEFEGEPQLRGGHFRIDLQEFVERRLPVPPTAAIAHIKVIPQGLTTKADSGDTQLRVRNFCGNEEVIALIFSGLRRVTDLSLKNVPPSLLKMGFANVDLCARSGCFMPQREKQFVTGANERRQEIRDQDGSAISKNALCIDAFRIGFKDFPLAHAPQRANSRLEWNAHGEAHSSTGRSSCQISRP